MDDVIKVLKQIVSSFSSFGSIPRPITICLSVFSGVFGFYLIFVYTHLDKQQTIWLTIGIAVMAVATGAYFLFKGHGQKEAPSGETAPALSSMPTDPGSARRARSESGATEDFWGSPPPQPRSALRSVSPVPSEIPRARPPSVTLQELTEPLFQYICRLNRAARRGKPDENTSFLTKISAAAGAPAEATGSTRSRGAGLDEVIVRSEIKALLEDLMTKASADARLLQQARKLELPLMFFADSMISESALPFAAQWNQNRLAYERQELAGDEKFYDLLDETMKESGEDAAERLAVFYTCIGLGFTGIYFKQPELLRKMMLSIAPRIRHLAENDPAARICPEAYQGVDTRNLVEPPSSRMVWVGLLFACFTLAVLISYALMYREASNNLNQSIQEVLRQEPAAQQQN